MEYTPEGISWNPSVSHAETSQYLPPGEREVEP